MSEQPGDDQPGDDRAASEQAAPVYGRVTRFGPPGVPAPPRAPAPWPLPAPGSGGAPAPWGAWPPFPPPPPAAPRPGPPDARWSPPGWSGPTVGAPVLTLRPRWRPEQYARWTSRVLGDLVDHAPGYVALVLQFAAYAPLYAGLLRGDVGAQPRWGLLVAGLLLSLASIGWNAYNRWVCAGRTGQSLGRRLTGSRLVSGVDGRPVGTLDAFLRDLLHVLDGFAWVGYLWPLWDEERQTFADKLADTVVLRVRDEQPDRWT